MLDVLLVLLAYFGEFRERKLAILDVEGNWYGLRLQGYKSSFTFPERYGASRIPLFFHP